MMEYKDYYKTLGVERNADAEAIKKAYRKLARQHHPDVNKGDKKSEDRFKEINEANDVLSDAEKRKVYDQLGTNYQQYRQNGGDPRSYDWSQWARQAGAQGAGGRPGGTNYEDLDFSDLMESMFGGRFGGQQAARRPRDVQQTVEISLDQAFHGTTCVVERDEQEIEVKIPPGVKSGSRIRVKGQGTRNARGQVSDLYLQVEVAPDSTYERQEDDLYRDAKVDAFTAILGGEATVATFGGSVVVTIPAGTSSGKKMRLRGKGMPKLSAKGEFGDMYLRIMITVPHDLAEEDRHALERIARKIAKEN